MDWGSDWIPHTILKGHAIAFTTLRLQQNNVQHIGKRIKYTGQESTDIPKEFYKLTDAQINMFGNQLSRLHELSHLAREGESYEILASKIKEKLRDPKQQKQFLPYLRNLGFKP